MAFAESFHPKFKSDLTPRSYHFQKNSTQYRIAYEVLEDDEIVFHYMVATRENFYKKLDNRVS